MYKPFPSRPSPLARAIASLGLALTLQSALAQNISFDIPAQPLPAALASFARQSGLQLAFPPAIAQGKQGRAVTGPRDLRSALDALLAGTGLQGAVQGKTLVIEPASAQRSVALGEVTVKANAERSATSEGTGSYAARAASIMKGVQSLKEIPQSVSVITRQQMDDQGFSSLEDVFTQLPGSRTDGYTGTMRVWTRGFQTSMQIDGVPEQQEYGGSGYKMDEAIYDRVEMLRGPTGLVTGTGEPGGTINLVRKRPRDQFAVAGNVSYGSWNNKRTDIDVTGPLNDTGTLRGRMVGVLQDNDRFYEVAHDRRNLVYGILEYDLTPRDTLGFSATRMKDVGPTFWGLPLYTDGSLPARNRYVGSTDLNPGITARDATLDYVHRFDNSWQGKATYSYRHDDRTMAGLFAYDPIADASTGLTSAMGSYREDTRTYHSFDAHLSGPFALFGRTHHATMGYNQTRQKYEAPTRLMPYYEQVDVLNRHDWGVTRDSLESYGNALTIEQSGIYGSVNFRLLDQLALVAGGRFSNYTYKSRSDYESAWVESSAKARNEFTPYAGLVFDLTDQVALYGSYSEIFVPQSTKDYTGSTLKPRTGEQFELGVKSTLLNNQLNASLAVYQMQDQNRSMTDTDPTHICPDNAGLRCNKAAGKIQSRGVEAVLSGSPLPGWNLSTSWSFNRSKYLSDSNAANVGKTVFPYLNPKHLFKLRSQNDLGYSGRQGWAVGAGVIAQSATADDNFRQGGYAIVSAKLAYRSNRNLDLSFHVDNLFDRSYLVDYGTDYYYNIYGKPRSYSLKLSYRFD